MTAKEAVGRVLSVMVTAGGWLVAGARTVLDFIGYSTVPEDVSIAQTRLERATDYLLSLLLGVPLWVPWIVALAITLFLMWVSWPRNRSAEAQPAPIDPYTAAADLIKQIRLQDKQDQLREGLRGQSQSVTGRDSRGLSDLILLHIEGTAILHEMGFQSDAEYALWVRRLSQWNRDANFVLSKHFPKKDADWFSILGVFEAPNCPNPYDSGGDHDHKYRMHWERVRRIGRIIDNHQRS